MKKLNNLSILRLLLIITIVIICSCKEKKTIESDSFYKIPFAEIIKNKREVKLSEIASEVEIVQFENTPEALLGDSPGIMLTKDFLFVGSGTNPVRQFSREGKFIRFIGKMGRGPGEYDVARTFSIDEKTEKIYIQTNSLGKIMVYNFYGEFIREIEYPAAIYRFLNVWSRDSFFVSFMEPMEGNEPYVFIEHNEQGDTLQTVANYIFWENPEHYYGYRVFSERNNFYRFEDKLHMKSWYNDTVYTYDENNKFAPKFLIDLEHHKIPDDLIYERKATRPIPADACWTGVHETPNYIFIPYGYYPTRFDRDKLKEERGCVLFNKKTKVALATTETLTGGFINDITGGPDFRPIFTNDTLAIMDVSALEMKQYLDSEQFEKKQVSSLKEKERLRLINKTLKENDNHFLILVRLK